MGNLLKTIDAGALLELGQECLFSLSTGDISSRLAETNTVYGLAKIIHILAKHDIDWRTMICLFTPDGGITRNKERWSFGFGYGCLLHWPDQNGTQPLMFPELKPNACGVLVAKLSCSLSSEEIYKRLGEVREKLHINGTPLTFNLGISNHFIEVCQVASSVVPSLSVGDEVAVIHTSPAELKEDLYSWEAWLQAGGRWEETPVGRILVLAGPAARKYFQSYQRIEAFSKARRLTIARAIFGEVEVVSNPTHQGLFSPNRLGLGLYDTGDTTATPDGGPVFPLTLRWDIPIYLIAGRQNLSPTVLKRRGIYRKAEERGVLEILSKANVLPHGGGYALPFDARSRVRVVQNGHRRFFHLHNSAAEVDEYVFTHPSELPYDYRGRQVMKMIEALEMGEPVAELRQRFTIKY